MADGFHDEFIAADELARLRLALQQSEPGQLIFIEIETSANRRRLADWLSNLDGIRPSLYAHVGERREAPVVDTLRTRLTAHTDAEVVFVDGLEQHMDDRAGVRRAIDELNLSREALSRLPAVVVFLVPPHVVSEIRRRALNLWSWRAYHFDLEPAVGDHEQVAIKWLHLSDLHAGAPRSSPNHHLISDALRPEIWRMVDRFGSPDLLLVTGDLAFAGNQYADVDGALERIYSWIREAAPRSAEPLLFTVPGNHDLARPHGVLKWAARILRDYGDSNDPDVRELRTRLWMNRDPLFIESLFAPYMDWMRERVLARLRRDSRCTTLHTSFFPGDISAVIEKQGFRLGLVGLNSAWCQYTGGSFEGKLHVSLEQFFATLPDEDDPLSFFDTCHSAFLLMHHPMSWLATSAQKIFLRDIYPIGRFDLCLYGHTDQARSAGVVSPNTSQRAYFQALPLMRPGHDDSGREPRSVGFAWGEIRVDGGVRVWPRILMERSGSQWAFDRDPRFDNPDDTGAVWLRDPRRTVTPAVDPDGHSRLIDDRQGVTGIELVRPLSGIPGTRPDRIEFGPGEPDRQQFEEPITGIRFLWIPGGTFQMGMERASPEWEGDKHAQPTDLADGEIRLSAVPKWEGDRHAQPAHAVQVSPFWLAETPVTNRQYEWFLQVTSHEPPRFRRHRRLDEPELPVVGVSWHDAKAFCAWLSDASDLPLLDLPSEAQWEFAARGPENRLYPWGNEAPDETRAYFDRSSDTDRPLPVGSVPGGRGPYGTLDQAGNVWEWCRDEWAGDAYRARGELTVDPVIAEPDGHSASARVARGGCFRDPARILRAAHRLKVCATDVGDSIGFRVAARLRIRGGAATPTRPGPWR